MTSLTRFYSGMLLLALLAPARAQAQAPGGVVPELPAADPRFGVSAHFARGHVLPALGNVRSWGGTGTVTQGAVELSAGGSLLDADSAESGWSVHGALAPQLCAPFRPASIDGRFHFCDLLPGQLALELRAGATHSALDLAGGDAQLTDATLGAAVSLQAPTPFATLEVWTSPRLQLRSANAIASGGDDRTVRVGGGWTLGLALRSTAGLGAHFVLDGLLIGRPPGEAAGGKIGFLAGLHYLH